MPVTRRREGPSGALPPDSQLGDGGGPRGAQGVTARSVNEKTPGWPQHHFHYCRRHGLLKRGPGVHRDRGERNTLLVQLFQGAWGTAPSSGLPAAQEKRPQTHAVPMSPQGCRGHVSHAEAEMKGDLMRFTASPESKTQPAVTILVSGVTRPRGQTTTHSHEAFQQADARHVGVR